MKLRVNHKNNQINVKSKLHRGEEINPREVEIFQTKLVRGMMRPTIEGKKKIVYCAPEGVTLLSYLKSGISKNDFFIVFAQIVEMTKTLEQYKLSLNNLILDLQYIFINKMTKEIYFIYQPILSRNISRNIFSFFYEVIHAVLFHFEEDTQWLNEFMTHLNCMQFYSATELEGYIERIYPKVYQQMKRYSPGQSQRLGDNSWNANMYNRETMPLEEEGGTVLLNGTYEEEGTQLLNEEEGTTLLGRTEYESQIYLVRKSDGNCILVNHPVFLIGKDRNTADYVVENNNAVSRIHAELITKGSSYYLKDKKSTNGTFINGKILEPEQEWELSDGDEIRFANEIFEFQIER